jgi:hypothetical protein
VTILSITQAAAIRAGLSTVPQSAVGSSDQNIQQIVSFAEDSGRELMERANWVNLDTAGTVTGDGISTLFQLPQDWVRFSPSDKSPRGALVSNKYPLLPLQGPINTEDLNLLKALPASTVRPIWRIIGGALEIWPAIAGPGGIFSFQADITASSATLTDISSTSSPISVGDSLFGPGIASGTKVLSVALPSLTMSVAAVATTDEGTIIDTPSGAAGTGELITFNYYSSFWISNAARTVFSQTFTADDNFCLINEDTIMKGALWRWKASKGLDYAEEMRAYEMSFARNAGQQQTERVVGTSRKYVMGDETFLGTITDLSSPLT